MATKSKRELAERKAAERAATERKALEAEKAKAEQEAAETAYRAEQCKRAQGIATGILTESTGGTALTLSVGEGCWDYTNSDLLRGTPGDTGRFTASMRQLKKDIAVRLTTDTEPNISRYLGFAALAKLWNRDKLLTLPRSIVQDACTMVTRDDTAPGLEYINAKGQAESAYHWVNGCEVKGMELLNRAADGVGTCKGLTLAEFTTARKEFCASGQGRHNQGGKNKAKGKGKAKGAAKKAASKLAAALKAIKDYASVAAIPVPTRIKGLRAAMATVKELVIELRTAVAQPATQPASAPKEALAGVK
jgi:hypothetical protein